MSAAALLQILLLAVVLAVGAPTLGRYLAAVYGDGPAPGDRWFAPIERAIYRLTGADSTREQRWTGYLRALLAFSIAGFGLLYLILRFQGTLPGNPLDLGAIPAALAFNTAVSFVTNTNWQAYGGETTMTFASQMAGLTVQNFLSAAAGMAVAVAIIRGVARAKSDTIGNFWVDLVRTTTRVLVPLSIVGAGLLIGTGVVQSFTGHTVVTTLEGAEQTLPGGPAASQVAIKQSSKPRAWPPREVSPLTTCWRWSRNTSTTAAWRCSATTASTCSSSTSPSTGSARPVVDQPRPGDMRWFRRARTPVAS